jgi:hypothetical protein
MERKRRILFSSGVGEYEFRTIIFHHVHLATSGLAWVAVLCVGGAAGVAVMSVDLGSEWMKVAVVSVGYLHPVLLAFRFITKFFIILYKYND